MKNRGSVLQKLEAHLGGGSGLMTMRTLAKYSVPILAELAALENQQGNLLDALK